MSFQTVQLLIERGADPNATGVYIRFILWTESGDEMAELLRAGGTNIKGINEHGDSPLHTACYLGETETVRLLIARGAKIELANNAGITPFHIACSQSEESIIQLILDSM
jgi:ankyrin repeat protein